MTPVFDAHNHLQDARLAPFLDSILHELPALGVAGAVVNGTCEEDWPRVAKLAAENSWIIPAFGLHPWRVASRSSNWLRLLENYLEHTPRAVVGEIGLDRWMQNPDLPAQEEVFLHQLALAKARNLPATIHCLKAFGRTHELLIQQGVPACGFLLHSYSGPLEMVRTFADLGAYFSFSGYFLTAKKQDRRDLFQRIPSCRLLVETDAPDMAPPPESAPCQLPGHLNHPGNLPAIQQALAQLRGENLAGLAENFQRLFVRRETPLPCSV